MAGAHHRGTYAARARKVRAAANANPATRCWRCGLTLAEVPGSTWDAGHLSDGRADSALAPEHSTCNRSAGATMGNRRRTQGTTREW
jgi:hypothetical protein